MQYIKVKEDFVQNSNKEQQNSLIVDFYVLRILTAFSLFILTFFWKRTVLPIFIKYYHGNLYEHTANNRAWWNFTILISKVTGMWT